MHDLNARGVCIYTLALADAFDLRREQGVQLVVALGVLRADALNALHDRAQTVDSQHCGIDSTASGWHRSIISARRRRKKSGVTIASRIRQIPQKSMHP
jgi:hypothetical protein